VLFHDDLAAELRDARSGGSRPFPIALETAVRPTTGNATTDVRHLGLRKPALRVNRAAEQWRRVPVVEQVDVILSYRVSDQETEHRLSDDDRMR
jgi:hypothetical protein